MCSSLYANYMSTKMLKINTGATSKVQYWQREFNIHYLISYPLGVVSIPENINLVKTLFSEQWHFYMKAFIKIGFLT